MSGDTLIVGTGGLDYETTTNYSVIVEISDGSNTSTGTMTITITNVNDNTPVISDDSASVAENTVQDTLVLTFSGSDADGDPLTYAIVGGNP